MTPPRGGRGRARALVLLLLVFVLACSKGAPDVAPMLPVLREDGQIVELLNEAEELARNGNTTNAARNLREVAVPRARANWEAAGHLSLQHPRSQALRLRLAQVTADRLDATERLATLFTDGNVADLHDVMTRMDLVDRSMVTLERDIDRARTQPPERGCAAR